MRRKAVVKQQGSGRAPHVLLVCLDPRGVSQRCIEQGEPPSAQLCGGRRAAHEPNKVMTQFLSSSTPSGESRAHANTQRHLPDRTVRIDGSRRTMAGISPRKRWPREASIELSSASTSPVAPRRRSGPPASAFAAAGGAGAWGRRRHPLSARKSRRFGWRFRVAPTRQMDSAERTSSVRMPP